MALGMILLALSIYHIYMLCKVDDFDNDNNDQMDLQFDSDESFHPNNDNNNNIKFNLEHPIQWITAALIFASICWTIGNLIKYIINNDNVPIVKTFNMLVSNII